MRDHDALADDEQLVPAPRAREEYLGGVSDMTLWRWLHNPALDFPRPIVINGRRYFTKGQLRAFRERLQKSGVAT